MNRKTDAHTDLRVSEIRNRHDSHFRDITPVGGIGRGPINTPTLKHPDRVQHSIQLYSLKHES